MGWEYLATMVGIRSSTIQAVIMAKANVYEAR